MLYLVYSISGCVRGYIACKCFIASSFRVSTTCSKIVGRTLGLEKSLGQPKYRSAPNLALIRTG